MRTNYYRYYYRNSWLLQIPSRILIVLYHFSCFEVSFSIIWNIKVNNLTLAILMISKSKARFYGFNDINCTEREILQYPVKLIFYHCPRLISIPLLFYTEAKRTAYLPIYSPTSHVVATWDIQRLGD